MKRRAVIELETESYTEQQFVLTHITNAVWVILSEDRTRFYIPYQEYELVEKVMKEWEKNNAK